jgi:hypothetical protein
VTSSGPSSRLLLLLVVSAACGGKSRVIPADAAPGSCVNETLMSQPPRNGAILAVPRSSVMAEALPGESRSRFRATRDSIVECLTGLAQSPYVGLVLNAAGESCENTMAVEAAPLAHTDQLEQLVAELEAVTEPAGTASLLLQYRRARSLASALPSDVHTALLLFMDGAPGDGLGCGAGETRELLSLELMDVLETGAQTPYLIATPGSGAGDLARGIALDIGCPSCALDFSNQPDFAAPLAEIISGNRAVDITCDFPVPVPPGAAPLDPDSVTVTLAVDGGTPELLPHLVECDDTDGFTIAGDPGRVVLCPATCAVLSTALMPTMTIEACAKP